jgi:hypothetical protein
MKYLTLLALLLATPARAQSAHYDARDHSAMTLAIDAIEHNRPIIIPPALRPQIGRTTLSKLPDITRQVWEAALDRELAARQAQSTGE